MATDFWNGYYPDDWNFNPEDWSQGVPPTSIDSAEIQTGKATLSTSGTAESLAIDPDAWLWLTDGAMLTVKNGMNNSGWLLLNGGDTVSIGGDITNSNTVSVDADWGNGGSAVTFGGVLTNTGAFAIGNSGLSAPTKVTAAALVNTGSLSVQGNTQNGTMNKASLIVSGAAPTTLTGPSR